MPKGKKVQRKVKATSRTTRSLPYIPTNIVVGFIEELAVETHLFAHNPNSIKRQQSLRDLGSCALVCHAWREVCLPIQWRRLALLVEASLKKPAALEDPFYALLVATSNNREPQKSLNSIISFLIDHPALSKYIQVLGLSTWEGFYPCPSWLEVNAVDFAKLLERLPSLKDLHLINILVRPVLAPRHRARLVFPKLEQLSYTVFDMGADTPLSGPTSLLAPLQMFSTVDQAIFRRTRCLLRADASNPNLDSPSAGPLRADHIRCRVRSLNIDTGEKFLPELLRTLSHVLQPENLHTLELAHVAVKDLKPHISGVLKRLAPTLKRLSLDFSKDGSDGDVNDENNGLRGDFLCELPLLQYLMLSFVHTTLAGTWEWFIIHSILSHIVPTSPHLRKIHIETRNWKDFLSSYLQCKAGARRLFESSLCALPHLEEVTFASSLYDQSGCLVTNIKEWLAFVRAFPLLDRKELVNVEAGLAETDMARMKSEYLETARAQIDA